MEGEELITSELEFARKVEEGEFSYNEMIAMVLGNIGHELGQGISIVYQEGQIMPDDMAKEHGVDPAEVKFIVLFKDIVLLGQVELALSLYNSKAV